MGVNAGGKRAGREQDRRGSGGADGICRADGRVQGFLRKIRGKNRSGPVHEDELHPVRGFVSVHRLYPGSGGGAFGLRAVRDVGGHHVAGDVQQGGSRTAQGRNGDVCLSGAGGRSGLLRRADARGICVGDLWGGSAEGDFRSAYFPDPAAGRDVDGKRDKKVMY